MKIDLVDVFGSGPLSGNPLAVVRGGDALTGEQMLALTRWLGFSETTFLLPPSDPGADYALRIFYPGGELPFAGHPTLGSCHAWLAAGGKPRVPGRIVQQCGVGLVELAQRESGLLAFRAPALTREGPLVKAERAEAIRIAGVAEAAVADAVHAANGPAWQVLRLDSAADVLAAQPEARATSETFIGLVGPDGAGFELRAFVSDGNGRIFEDPVTGSLNAAVAQYLFAQGLAKGSYIAGQGRKVGADGRVFCSREADGSVWVGGRTVTVASGADLAV